ncbi:MAG: DUF4293 domain-containing protein [Ferruginibacter sp.]
MIQRIQSVWFLVASICAFLSLKLPFYIGTTKDHIAGHQLIGTENLYLLFLTIAIGLLAFVTIFLFKKRRIQIRLSVLGIMLELVLILLYYLEVRTYLDGTYALSALLQSCVVFFFFLALRGIGKDIKLIKNSDRLR